MAAEIHEIPGFSNYGIDTNGNLKRKLKTGQYENITPKEEHGSLKIALTNDQKTRNNFTVQKFMAITFLGLNPEEKVTIEHINGNSLDNRLENLNIKNIQVKAPAANPRGYGTSSKKIWRVNPATNERVLYDSVSDAITWVINNDPTIVINGKVENFIINNRKHINSSIENNTTCFGYKWEYENNNIPQDDEVWMVTIYPGYEVSNYGSVRGPNKTSTKGHKSSVGSMVTDINGHKRTIHNLVAAAFMDVGDKDVRHKDGDKTNNRIDNLELVEHVSNLDTSKKITQYDLQMNIIEVFDSITAAANKLNINRKDISKCCSGNIDSVGQFIFKTADV
jgi:hypothetical protein